MSCRGQWVIGALVSVGISLSLQACGGDEAREEGPGEAENNDPGEPEATPEPEEEEGALTFYRDIQPVLTLQCGACHFKGGAAPFALSTFEEVKAMGPAVAQAIKDGTMPPWRANPDCRSFKGERLMPEADKAAVIAWVEAGMAPGDPADAVAIEAPSLRLDDVSLTTRSSAPYTAKESRPDDYHCLVMDAEFTEEKYLQAYQVVPDVVPLVHHVVLYLIPQSNAAAMMAEDAASPEPGYTCFGSSGHGGQPMGVWVPGAVPQRFPDDSAFVIPRGSKIVAQMHYNTISADAAPDQTALQMSFSSDPPRFQVTMPILAGQLNIEAGDPASVQELSFVNRTSSTRQIVSVMPHMHVLGTSIDLWRVRDGQETCIVQVDDWEFNWQQFYDLKDDEFIELAPGDELRFTCTYDNSAANQPVINGEQIEPRDVHFGEGTLDEMCVQIIALIEPFKAEGQEGGACGGFSECNQACDGADPYCFLTCAINSGEGCAQCVFQGLNACGGRLCRPQLSPVIACLTSCEDEIGTCLYETCRPEYEIFWECMEAPIQEGQCEAEFSSCDLGL